MSYYSLIGIDPGLVHTGVVGIHLDTERREIEIEHEAIQGDDVAATNAAVERMLGKGEAHIFIEQYRNRGTVFREHGAMQRFEHDLKAAISGAVLLDNMGSKQLISPQLMTLLGVWNFPTTNHRDLQAAARIAILGGIKDTDLNAAITAYVEDELDKFPWRKL
jgi:hypothetical protein